MAAITTFFARLCAITLLGIILAFVLLHISYIPVRDGKLYLKQAKGTATLLREAETGIQHIDADTVEMAAYAQGFGHAQDRLWQMMR